MSDNIQDIKIKRKPGRPRRTKSGSIPVTITIRKDQREKFKQLGASLWLQKMIDKS